INTAAELSAHMLAAKAGYVFDGSTTGQVLGAASLADVKNTGNAATALGDYVFVVSTVEAARRALEPQSITSFDVTRADTLWVEDRPSSPPAFWDHALVTARGKSFNLAKATLETLITAIGSVPGPVGTAVGAGTLVAPGSVNDAVDSLTGGSCFRIKAPKYGPIDVTDKAWTKATFSGDAVTKASHQQYFGAKIGTSTLKVALRDAKFGVEGFYDKSFPIKVEQIDISLLPSFTHVDKPGDQIKISATAANAYTNPANLIADVPSGNGQIVGQADNGDFHDVEYVTPSDRTKYPTGVRFRWQGKTLPGGTARSAVSTVDTKGKVTISPQTACLLPGNQLSLTATLEGFTSGNKGVTWSASAGRIVNATGLTATFDAPSGTGTVTVTVTADADSSVTDSVQYTVSNTCIKKVWYPGASIALDGDGVYSTGPTVCPADNHDPTQEVDLLTDPADVYQPPAVPPDSALWYSRSRSISQNYAHTSTRYEEDDSGSSPSCSRISLDGQNSSTVTYSATGAGKLELNVQGDIRTTCDQFSTGDMGCVSGETLGSVVGFYYLTVSSSSNYHLSGELSCSNVSGYAAVDPITGTIERWVGGTTPFVPFVNPDGTLNTGVRDANGNYRSPQLFQVSCNKANKTVPIDVDFTLDGPSTSQPDLVVLHLQGVAGMCLFPAYAKQGISPAPCAPGGVPTSAPGSFDSSGNLDFWVKLGPQ
ncbi:MAG TPA: hypothetical protein VKA32_10625, partial [Gammaproteobacteria bacterium]|nr:hypothetical protein [Gammaproteobacteria bacterium]